MIEFPLLKKEDIFVKVKQVTKAGALLLLYKTARTDAKYLDEVLGPMNWTNEYVEIKNNLYCRIGIREKEDQEFVYKMDCGIESDQDDGQEKKAEASDAFKRCASKLGLGRELYTAPQIWAAVNTVQKGEKWFLEDKTAKYYVSKIEYDEKTRTIIDLEIRNAKTNVVVYTMPPETRLFSDAEDLDFGGEAPAAPDTTSKKEEAKKKTEEKTTTSKKEEKAEKTEKKEKVEKKETETKAAAPDLQSLVREVGAMVKALIEQEGSPAKYKDIVKKVTGDTTFKCNVATEDDYNTVLAIHDELIASGFHA